MATTQQIGIDVSQLVSGMQQAVKAFQQQNQAVQQTAITYLRLNAAGQQVRAGFQAIATDGTKLEGVIKQVNGQFVALTQKISQSAAEMRRLKKEQADLQQQQQVAQIAPFVQGIESALPIPAGTTSKQFLQFQTALNKVTTQAVAAKIPLQQLQQAFTNIARDPFKLIAATSPFAAVEQSIQRLILKHRELKGAQEETGTGVEKAGKRMLLTFQGLVNILQRLVVFRVFGGLINNMESAISKAADFSQKLGEIQTIADRLQFSTGQLSGRIAEIAVEFNKTPTDVAEGVYQGVSNQIITTAASFDFMREAARLSRITVSSTGDAVNALSSILNAYQRPVSEAAVITDQLFRAVDIGRFRLGDIAEGLGRTTISAANLGIPLEDILSFLTLITRSGLPVSQTMTQLNQLLFSLLRPSSELKATFKDLFGTESGLAAIQRFGLQDVLRQIAEEAERGNVELTELFANRRGAQAILGITRGPGIEVFERERAQFFDPSLQQRAADASIRIQETVGVRFRSEFNKLNTFLETDFGPKFLASILKIGEPFGGLANLIIEVIKPVELLGRVLLGIGSIVTSIAAPMASLGFSFQTLTAAAVGFFAASRGAPIIIGAIAAIEGAIRSLIAGSVTLGATLSSAFVALIPILSITLLATFVSQLGAADREAEKFRQTLVRIETQQRKNADELNRLLTRQNEAFRGQATNLQRRLLSIMAPLAKAADELRDRQREAFRGTTTELTASARTITDQMARIIGDLKQKISDSESNIKDSLRRTKDLAESTSRSLFQSQLEAAGQGPIVSRAGAIDPQEAQVRRIVLMEEEKASQNQIRLIQERINQLIREADEFSARGTRDSMESARRRYDEAKQLIEQQFNIEQSARRRTTQAEAEDAARSGGGIVVRRFNVNLQELQRRLQAIDALRNQGERTFQSTEQASIENNQRLVDAERQREALITRTQQQLIQFSLLGRDSELQPQFRGERGGQEAIRQFEELAEAARAARAPIQLTTQELQKLKDTVGLVRAGEIQQGLLQGTLTTEQQAALGGALSVERAQILNQSLDNHRINQEAIRDLERRIGEQRVQIERQVQAEILSIKQKSAQQQIIENVERINEERNAAATQTREAAGERDEVTTRLLRQTDLIRRSADLLPGGGFGIYTSVRPAVLQLRRDIISLSEEAATSLNTFNTAPTEEGLGRTQEKMRRLITAFRLLGQEVGGAQVPGTGLTGTQISQGGRLVAEQLLADLQAAQGRVAQGNVTLQSTENQIRNITEATGLTLPRSLQETQTAATNMGSAINTSLGTTAGNIANVAREISNLATAVQKLTDAAAGQRIQAAPLVGPRQADGTFAEGGLIGGKFTGKGRDDRLIFARTGEFIVNPASTRAFYPQLRAMNAGNYPKHYSQGGLVDQTNVGDISINVSGSSSPEATGRAVFKLLRREMRKGNGKL